MSKYTIFYHLCHLCPTEFLSITNECQKNDPVVSKNMLTLSPPSFSSSPLKKNMKTKNAEKKKIPWPAPIQKKRQVLSTERGFRINEKNVPGRQISFSVPFHLPFAFKDALRRLFNNEKTALNTSPQTPNALYHCFLMSMNAQPTTRCSSKTFMQVFVHQYF